MPEASITARWKNTLLIAGLLILMPVVESRAQSPDELKKNDAVKAPADPAETKPDQAEAAPPSEPKKKTAQKVEPKKTALDKFDAWVGDTLVGPLWNNVLGYPLGKTTVVDVFTADDAALIQSGVQPPPFKDPNRKVGFKRRAMQFKKELADAGLITEVSFDDKKKTATYRVPLHQYDAAVKHLQTRGLEPTRHAPVFVGNPDKAQKALTALETAGIETTRRITDKEAGEGENKTTVKEATVSVPVADHGRAMQVLAAGSDTAPKPMDKTGGLPIIVLVLVVGGLFFTFRFGFLNLRLFKHSIAVIRGKFDKPEDTGEISHFQALTSALSATVGLGNIAGVAVAISAGGPGALMWMWLIAFFGMSTKFASCSLAQVYRRVDENGHVLGGPMVYLSDGFRDLKPSLAGLGKVFAVVFAVFTVFAAFGGGNMFQANQTYAIINSQFMEPSKKAAAEEIDQKIAAGELEEEEGKKRKKEVLAESVPLQLGIGILMAFLVGLVLIGGIKRIGRVTSKIVPLMCAFYCAVCIVIILMNASEIPSIFASIFSHALSGQALFGGFLGILVMGAKRAAFSNEAGLGSAAIAHSAAKTNEPIREGVVAMVGPFIDTIVVCTMTALAILATQAHLDDGVPYETMQGVVITAKAFEVSLGGAVPYILTLAVFVFAYSTLISWSYYGERAIEYLFGKKGIMPYRLVYVFVIILGPILSLNNVIGFADMMLLSMAFPNIIGLIILSPKLAELTRDYVGRLRSGEMKPVSEGWPPEPVSPDES